MSDLSAAATLHPEANARLDEFLLDFKGLQLKGLRAIYVIGPAARGEFNPSHPEINLLAIFDEVSADCIEAVAGLGQSHGRRGMRAPLLLTVDYIEHAGDVFAMELLDLSQNGLLIDGDDLLAGVEIDKPYLRLQVERELRSLRLAIRQQYLRAAGDRNWMAGWFSEAIVDIFPVFRAMLHLETGDAAYGNTDVTTRLAKLCGVNLTPFIEIYELRKKGAVLSKARVREMVDAWEAACAALVKRVDAYEV